MPASCRRPGASMCGGRRRARASAIDHGMKDGLAISPFYDPMIAKVIAHGADREEARTRLVQALRDTVVLGPTTNRHFLIRLLEHPEFAAGKATTAFIGQHFAAPKSTAYDRTGRSPRRCCGAGRPSAIPPPCAAGATPIPNRRRSGSPSATHGAPAAPRCCRLPSTTRRRFDIDGDDIVVDLDALTVRFRTGPTRRPPRRRPAATASCARRWTAASSPSTWRPATTSCAARP